MTRLVTLIALFLLVPLAVPLAALDVKIQPGLWQHSYTMKTESGLLEGAMDQLAALAPGQKQMIEQMMANQGASFAPSGNSIQVCISAEDAARGQVPQLDSNCRQQVLKQTGNSIRVRFSCASDPPASGEGEITFTSPTSYTGSAVVDTKVHGVSERMNIAQQGKWLAADCGGLKPLGQ